MKTIIYSVVVIYHSPVTIKLFKFKQDAKDYAAKRNQQAEKEHVPGYLFPVFQVRALELE
jgi:hypothetical protein